VVNRPKGIKLCKAGGIESEDGRERLRGKGNSSDKRGGRYLGGASGEECSGEGERKVGKGHYPGKRRE